MRKMTYEVEEETSKLLTVNEVAKMLRVDPATVRRMLYNKKIPGAFGIPAGKSLTRKNWRIPRHALAAVLEVQENALPVLPG